MNEQSELEKIARRCERLIICDVKKCEMKGDYWKCYMGNYTKCPIYQSWKDAKFPYHSPLGKNI